MMKDEYDYLANFGQIKFAEEDNLVTTDFENSLFKFFKKSKSDRPHGRYKFGEINNKSINDFTDSLDMFLK